MRRANSIVADSAPARRKRRSASEIRERMLGAAAEMFELHGYASATTAAIAQRADVSEAQIFRYFESKAALFRAAIFEPLNAHFANFQARQQDAGPDATYRDQARTYITELQAFIATHSRMLQSLVVAQAYDRLPTGGVERLEGLHDYFARGAAMMAERIGDGADQARISPEVMVRVSFAAVLGCALFGDWMFDGSTASPAQVQDAVIGFVIDGLYVNAGGDGEPP